MPSNSDSRRFSKLPKWAQIEIEHLRANAARASQELKEALGGPDDSNCRVRDYLEDDKNLPRHALIEFDIGKSRITARVGRDDDVLYISGDRAISIEPRAANVVTITLKDF